MPLISQETDEETKLAIIKENHERSAAEILKCYHAAQTLCNSTKSTGLNAIEQALRCGTLLNAKKDEVKLGNWLDWIETYLPEINLRTAQRWMQLAKASRDVSLDKIKPKSLRQAYVAVGIFPDPVTAQRTRLNGQSKPLKPSKTGTSALSAIHALKSEKSIEALIQTQDFSSWDTINLEIMVRELEPITSMRSRMVHALAEKLKANV